MLRPPPFPRSIDDLDIEVLGDCLGGAVESFTSQRIGADRGMLGEIFVITPAYAAGQSGPTQVVAKFAALREGSLASARRGGTHERELRCFDELLGDTPVTAPSCYGAFYNPDDATFLLIQDAVETDPSVDQISGITIGQARLVLSQAARLHAHWWNAATLQSATWLPRLDSEQRIHNLSTIAQNGWPQLVEMLGDELTEQERQLGSEFPSRIESALRSLALMPSTLLHCDLRADNLLFSPSGDRVSLIDWQGAGSGPPSFDLAYFLSQSLTVAERRLHEHELLDFYRTELAAAGLDLTAEEVRMGYGESMHFGLAIACALPLIGDPEEPRVRTLASTVARRSIDALRDHGQLWET